MQKALRQEFLSQQERNAAYQALAAARGLLPIKVTPFYQRKVDAEVAALGHYEGPLARLVYPTQERLSAHAPGEVADWVDDRGHMPEGAEGIFIHKYPDRVLFTPTSVCAAHCLYCFRQDVLSVQKKVSPPPLESQLDVLAAYLHKHPEVSEVILSGGDPLGLSSGNLESIFTRLSALATIRHFRLHTRMPIFAPQALKDDGKIKLLAAHKVRVVIHAVHPYEICAEVADILLRLHGAGVALYNQFPLLRGTNDHAEVLLRLLYRLEECGTHPLSIFVPEPVRHSAPYRISWRRMLALVDEVSQRSPAWLHAFRFCLDSPAGKIQRGDMVLHDTACQRLYFRRGAARVTYPDFPESMDIPGQLSTMLWRG